MGRREKSRGCGAEEKAERTILPYRQAKGKSGEGRIAAHEKRVKREREEQKNGQKGFEKGRTEVG